MERIIFGKTGLRVSKVAFGGIPIMRLSKHEAVEVVKSVIGMGINFLDTANAYGHSEEVIGEAIKDVPQKDLVLSSKSLAVDGKTFTEHLELSLKRLGVSYIDVYHLHNISTMERFETAMAEEGAYEALVRAVEEQKVRHTAFSSHNLEIAKKMMETGAFEVIQFPFNFVDEEALHEIIPLANKLDMGFIAMKPLGGGLLDNASLCFRYLLQFDGIVPDPGIEKSAEMQEIFEIVEEGKPLSAHEREEIERKKEEMGNEWCHRCDYCQPCPEGIPISLILSARSIAKRMPLEKANSFAGPAMEKTLECTDCRTCVERCPYDLEIPELLKRNRSGWETFAETGSWPVA